MKSFFPKYAVILLAVFFTGCAGTDFIRVTDDALVMGQTTYEQVSAKLGQPYQEGTVTKNEHQLKTASYAYANTGGEPDDVDVVPARSQGFYFMNNKLVGYEFTSSWKVDSTNFDTTKIAQIKRGETSRDEVIRLLGKPGGKYVYPVITNRDEDAFNYLHNQTRGSAFNLKFYQKQLVITFNKQGIVTNVDFTESGTK